MEIRIGKTARKCAASDRPFEHGDQVTSLVRMQEGELVREDYTEEGWDPSRAEGALAVWTTTFCDPKKAEEQPPEAFSPLRQAFYESAESTERPDLAKAYLAAQLLRRQKAFRLLKEFDAPDGDIRVALFADRIGGKMVEVHDPSLTWGELESGRTALVTRLAELEQPESPTEDNDDETPREEAQLSVG